MKGRGEWRDIRDAKKDRTPILVCLHPSIFPTLRPNRPDLEQFNGLQIVMRHPGLADDGFDIGWSFAAPVGHGGFPDEWIVGWMPLPPPRKGTEAVTIKEIPRSFEYCCDKCKASHLQQNASGHYTNSTPPQWFRLRLHSDYYRYPVANEEPTRLLCQKCGDSLRKLLNDFGLAV